MLNPCDTELLQLLNLSTRNKATVDVQGYVEPGLRRPTVRAAHMAVFAYDVGFCVARSAEMGNAKALYRNESMTVSHVSCFNQPHLSGNMMHLLL